MTTSARQAGRSPHPAAWVPHLYAFMAPATAALGLWLGGWWVFLGFVYAITVNTTLDLIVGNRFGPPDPMPARPAQLLVWLALPVQAALLAYGLLLVASTPMPVPAVYGVALSVGLSGATLGIVAAHELVHRQSGWERGVGVCLLMLVSYAHFRIEHVYNHHRRAATPADPATARRGESIYAFFPRTVVGQAKGAWQAERRRLGRVGRLWWHPANRMLWYLAAQGALHAAVFAGLGWLAWLVFFLQGGVAVFLLELTNYVEHYGLERREIAPGRYEPFGPLHAWNTGHPMTDFGMINLGRHSAHHRRADRPYIVLDNPADAPQLPAGYAGSGLLAMVPPLWRRVMDPRVDAVRRAQAPAN